MSEIIRKARQIYGPEYDRMFDEASQIKKEYLDGGGDPSHVISPERLQTLQSSGPDALMAEPPQQRGDGSIAGPYVPTELAIATNMIEKRAMPAVLKALQDGVNTVSSGYDEGRGVGYAIGRAPSGHVVRVEQ
jgi:hypothetical protein